MRDSLESLKTQLADVVLGFLWQQWARIGARAGIGDSGSTAIDPEPLLLLTLECARRDPRIFDEVLDWLATNGKWINVVRLGSLLEADNICEPSIIAAVARTMSGHDRTPKWKVLAARHRPSPKGQPRLLFERIVVAPEQADPLWVEHGWLRPPIELRGMSAEAISANEPLWKPATVMFKARALFGVNIRADVFAWLALHQSGANPNRIARELGYSQRRVHDALAEMSAAGIFRVRAESGRSRGSARIFSLDEARREALGVPAGACWMDWRALARAWSAAWRAVFNMRSEGLTPYVLESETQKLLRQIEDDLRRVEALESSRGEAPLKAPGVALIERLSAGVESHLDSSGSSRSRSRP